MARHKPKHASKNSRATQARVVSVNLARVRPNPYEEAATTGIDKRPTRGPVLVRAPGTKADDRASKWKDTLSRDPWVEESLAILSDMK